DRRRNDYHRIGHDYHGRRRQQRPNTIDANANVDFTRSDIQCQLELAVRITEPATAEEVVAQLQGGPEPPAAERIVGWEPDNRRRRDHDGRRERQLIEVPWPQLAEGRWPRVEDDQGWRRLLIGGRRRRRRRQGGSRLDRRHGSRRFLYQLVLQVD